MKTPVEQAIKQIARAYKADPETFDTTFLFDYFSLSFETGFDAVAAAGLPNDLTAKFGNIFDNFAFTERASFRKDVIDYLLIETLHKGFETLFCPGPEMGLLFSAFMSSNVSGTVTVGGLEDSITHIALRIADRYRYRFNNAWERAEKEHPEDAARLAEPEAVELKKFILEGNTLDSFFEGMIQNALKIDIPVAVALAHVHKDLLRSEETTRMFMFTKVIKEIKAIQVMTLYGGIRVDGKGINPFVIFPKSEAEIVAAMARKDADMRHEMSPQLKLFNEKKDVMEGVARFLFE